MSTKAMPLVLLLIGLTTYACGDSQERERDPSDEGQSGASGASASTGASASSGAAGGKGSSGGTGSSGKAGSAGTSGGNGGRSGRSGATGGTDAGGSADGGTSGSAGGTGKTDGGAVDGRTDAVVTRDAAIDGRETGPGGGVKLCAAAGTLKEAGACNGKLIGAALTQGQLSNGNYTAAAREHDFVTPENELKWDTVQPTRGNFNFGPANNVVNFARTNGMRIKGHTLVWHSQLPGWVSSLSTAADVRSVMITHIQRVMGQFKGRIHAWDVVNEAWDTPNKNGDGTATLRNSVFRARLGEGYIDEAFVAAREADPDALLFYNDYSTEGMNDKSNAVYNMVKSMKERGIPIDGVGIQMHIGTPNDTPTAAEVKQNIDRLTALGLQVMISEMDVNGCDGYTAESMAKVYYDVVRACVENPLCTAITFWGISDSGSWLNTFGEAGCNGRSPTPLLWDASYAKKATYNSVVRALTGN